MVSIRPVAKALIPADTTAANAVSAPNYDEFQSDDEVFDMLRARPDNVLKVTMPHVAVTAKSLYLEEGGEEALNTAAVNMRHLKMHNQMRTVENNLYIYDITGPANPGVRQIGLGGYGKTAEIRTEATPDGCIIRNEGIRQEKADGRARLIEATQSYIGTVNLVVQDKSGEFVEAMESVADSREPSFEATDEDGNLHRVWMVEPGAEAEKLTTLLAHEPASYVADGNHRSAAAAALGKDDFLCVFFTCDRMGLAPYNRLVSDAGVTAGDIKAKLGDDFDLAPAPESPFAPNQVGTIGIYLDGAWHSLTPKAGTYDAADAAASIDSDIVQKNIFAKILGITDPKDKKLNFVGGNKDAAYLQSRVDNGEYVMAVSLAPVTMDQFVAVCEQNRFMPPKSTWFVPKIRSGLVIALLD